MKKLSFPFLLLFVCLFANNTFSQTKTLPNSYFVNGLTDASKINFYKGIIESKNFEYYRLRSKNVVLEFGNGFSLELISAEKLKENSINIDPLVYLEDFPAGTEHPIFSIDDSGALSGMHKQPASSTKKQKSINIQE